MTCSNIKHLNGLFPYVPRLPPATLRAGISNLTSNAPRHYWCWWVGFKREKKYLPAWSVTFYILSGFFLKAWSLKETEAGKSWFRTDHGSQELWCLWSSELTLVKRWDIFQPCKHQSKLISNRCSSSNTTAVIFPFLVHCIKNKIIFYTIIEQTIAHSLILSLEITSHQNNHYSENILCISSLLWHYWSQNKQASPTKLHHPAVNQAHCSLITPCAALC